MADWSLPSISNAYTEVLAFIHNKILSSARMFRGVTDTNLPDGVVRFSDAELRWEVYSASTSTWSPLADTYSINISGNAATADTAANASNATVAASAATAVSATNSDKVDNFHASQAPTAGQIPVLSVDGKLNLPVGSAVTIGGVGLASDICTVPIRQCVLSGSVDGSGNYNYMTQYSGLTITLKGSATPLVLAFAAGYSNNKGAVDFVGAIQSDTQLALPASSTCYVYVDRDSATGALTAGYTTVAPINQTLAPTNTAGTHWFSTVSALMSVGNGTIWTVKQRVFLGTVVTGASAVTTVTCNVFLNSSLPAYVFSAVNATNATNSTNSTKLAGQNPDYYRCAGCSWTCSSTCTGSCHSTCLSCTGCTSCTGCGNACSTGCA